MSKQLAIACLLMGKGFGQKVYEYDLEDDSSHSDDLSSAQLLVGWAVTAVEMVELAYAITMEYPDDHEASIYKNFSNWYGEDMSENDDFEPPDDEECMEWLVENIMDEFSTMLNDVQQKRLKALLEAINH